MIVATRSYRLIVSFAANGDFCKEKVTVILTNWMTLWTLFGLRGLYFNIDYEILFYNYQTFSFVHFICGLFNDSISILTV
jgi:hypothetical protein